jgi:hypothetical protein
MCSQAVLRFQHRDSAHDERPAVRSSVSPHIDLARANVRFLLGRGDARRTQGDVLDHLVPQIGGGMPS